MLNEEAQLIAIVSNEELPQKVDAIVCLEGDDDYIRADKCLELFKSELSPIVIVLGRKDVKDYFMKKGLSENDIKFIEGSRENTSTEADEVIKEVKKMGWKSIILVTSAFHQPRAFLAFLKEAENLGLIDKVKIFNAPTQHTWFEKIGELNRLELLSEEFKKIKEYQKKGHLASIKEALEYQKWKEQQN